MPIDTTLRSLADLLEESASDGVSFERVSAATDGDELTAEVTVEYPLELAETAETVTVTDSEFKDGSVHVDVSVTVDTDMLNESTGDGTSEPPAGSSAPNGETTETIPAYKDPERLEAVYEECDSFAEMKDALDADVTAQTVRRSMIKHGIHEPASNADDTDGDDRADDGVNPPEESEPAPTPSDQEFESTDLPSGITPEAVRDAVAESSSLHGAQMALDLEMAETRALLKDLGVLEHVTGRLADRDDDPDPVEIERQIYDSLTARADGGNAAH